MSATPNEYSQVELPFIEQLKTMGWQHIAGDVDVPDFTERQSFCEVLLLGRLREALRRINLDDDGRGSTTAGSSRRSTRSGGSARSS